MADETVVDPNIITDPTLIRYGNRLREAARLHMVAFRSSEAVLLDGNVNGYLAALAAQPDKFIDFGDVKISTADLLLSASTDAVVEGYVRQVNPENPGIKTEPPLNVIVRVARTASYTQ